MKREKEEKKEKRELSVLEIVLLILLLCIIVISIIVGTVIYLQGHGLIPKHPITDTETVTTDVSGNDISQNAKDQPQAGSEASDTDVSTDYKIADAEEGDTLTFNQELSAEEYNTFTGYGAVWVSKDQPTVPFVNDATNTSYAKYSIYDGDKLLYETDLIAPGKHLDWDAYKDLKAAGTYKLTQKCQFFSPVIKDGKRTGFIEDGVAISNPEFVITVK